MANAIDDVKLLPCPFCGGEAILLKDHKKFGLYVACTVCAACTITGTQPEAIAAWNRRASPAPSQHTGWSDEAVEAALRARVPGGSEVWHWINGGGMSIDDTHREVMRTILAALSAPSIAPARMPHSGAKVSDIVAMIDADTIAPATGFEVKALEWHGEANWCHASSAVAHYRVSRRTNPDCYRMNSDGLNHSYYSDHPTPEAAKAAAFKHHEAYVRSALTPNIETGEVTDETDNFRAFFQLTQELKELEKSYHEHSTDVHDRWETAERQEFSDVDAAAREIDGKRHDIMWIEARIRSSISPSVPKESGEP